MSRLQLIGRSSLRPLGFLKLSTRTTDSMPRRRNKRSNAPGTSQTKRKPRPRRKAAAKQVVQVNTAPRLSGCAVQYARALTDPFSSFSELPCVPSLLSLPSHKSRNYCQGTFTVGTTGVGWVAVNTYGMMVNDGYLSGSNSFSGVYYTTATYPSPNYSWNASAGVLSTGVSAVSPIAPYTWAQINPSAADKGVKSRLVGCGVRARYIGTSVNMSGRIGVYRNNTSIRGSNDGGSTTIATMSAERDSYSTAQADRRWHYVLYAPANETELAYGSYASLVNESWDQCHLLLMVEGAVAGMSFEWEVVCFYEYANGPLTSAPTPSHSDATGMGAVVQAIQRDAGLKNANAPGYFTSTVNRALGYLKSAVSGVGEFVGKWGSAIGGVIGTAGGAILGNPQAGYALGSAVGGVLGRAERAGTRYLTGGPTIEDIE